MNFNDLELLKFMEARELDSNSTSSLGRMIQVNFFECSSFVLEAEFLHSFGFLKTWWRMRVKCILFIVVSEYKTHFELISLKISCRL